MRRTRWRSSTATVRARAANKAAGDNNYLTDGHMTLVVMPWDITDYEGTGIVTAAWTHRFQVENLDQLKATSIASRRQPAVGAGTARIRRGRQEAARTVRRSCPLGQHQMADCDGVLIDVAAD